jgi:hypothetical protein
MCYPVRIMSWYRQPSSSDDHARDAERLGAGLSPQDARTIARMFLRHAATFVIAIAAFACGGDDAVAASTLFRVVDMDLRDPHIFFDFISCNDVTDNKLIGFAVNSSLQDHIQGDNDPADGYLDLSYVLEFRPLDQAAGTNALTFGMAQCTAPAETSVCAPLTAAVDTTATLSDTTACLTPLAGTLHPYVPTVTNATAPCFGSSAATFQLDLAGLPVSLHDTQVAATFDGAPATGLVNGLVRGFLSEADANATMIPASYPVVGGQPLASILPGGTNACPAFSDKDLDGDTPGWWFYLNFVASPVAADRIFADAFE